MSAASEYSTNSIPGDEERQTMIVWFGDEEFEIKDLEARIQNDIRVLDDDIAELRKIRKAKLSTLELVHSLKNQVLGEMCHLDLF